MLLGPNGFPEAAAARIRQVLGPYLKNADVQKRLHNLGISSRTTSAEGTRAHVRSEYERWGKAMQVAGIKPK